MDEEFLFDFRRSMENLEGVFQPRPDKTRTEHGQKNAGRLGSSQSAGGGPLRAADGRRSSLWYPASASQIATERPPMTTRREFLGTTAGALAGIAFVGCDLLAAAPARAQLQRREVVVSGQRTKVVDVHAHCAVDEAMALMGMKLGAPGPATRPDLSMATHVSERLRAMDEQGIDVEALSINPYWYKAHRDLAGQIIKIQNEKLAEACAAHPDRFVAFATVALQYPDLAAEQLGAAIKHYGLRGPTPALRRRHVRADQEKADRVPWANVLRHDGVHARRTASPRGRGRRQPARDRHRLSVSVDENRRGPRARHAGPQRRAEDRDSGRYRGGPARHQGVAALAGRATGATCARSASGSRQHCKAPLTLTSERKETSALVVLVPGAESGQFPGVLFLQPEPEEIGRASCRERVY